LFSADSSTSANDNQADSEKNHPGGLEHSAAVHFAASQTRPIIPEVEVVTGEEDEKNVLQVAFERPQDLSRMLLNFFTFTIVILIFWRWSEKCVD